MALRKRVKAGKAPKAKKSSKPPKSTRSKVVVGAPISTEPMRAGDMGEPIKEIDLGGRPTVYSQELAERVCELIASGMSLTKIQKLPGMPERRTVLRWAFTDREGFAALYARARELQLEGEADEIVDIADESVNDFMTRENGNGESVTVPNKELIERSRLRIATRQWRLQRLMQNKYGDKIEQKHTGDAFASMWKAISEGQNGG